MADQRILTGQGGAEVWLLDGKRVLKRCHKSDKGFAQCVRESLVYEYLHGISFPRIPALYENTRTADEVTLVMEALSPIPVTAPDVTEVASLAACLHAVPAPPFLAAPDAPSALSEDTLADCLAGWRAVLNEHGDLFSFSPIERIARHINAWNRALRPAKNVFTHGDFHAGNLLSDARGAYRACDFQSASLGDPAGDLAFFLSRLRADGGSIDEAALLRAYAACAPHERADRLAAAVRLSNVNVSFVFWHAYLHNNPASRVATVYDAMTADARALRDIS